MNIKLPGSGETKMKNILLTLLFAFFLTGLAFGEDFYVYDNQGNATYYYGDIDQNGNFDVFDQQGNYYYGNVERDGSFEVYDQQGSYRYGNIDEQGDIDIYDNRGNYQHYYRR